MINDTSNGSEIRLPGTQELIPFSEHSRKKQKQFVKVHSQTICMIVLFQFAFNSGLRVSQLLDVRCMSRYCQLSVIASLFFNLKSQFAF